MRSKCPYCKERIKEDAIKCRHCGSVLKEGYTDYASNQGDPISLIKNILKERYEIIDLIGKGGMASVYKAKQINLDRIVALKVIHPNLIHDKEFVERFLREAKISASLTHPNIVNIYDYGQIDGISYISMEYIDGNDLSTIINNNHRLNEQTTISLLLPIADALLYIHNKGLLHRDVKAANILITSDKRPVLTDFGIAHAADLKPITIVGSLLGTPEYLSPEQAEGSNATAESDFYSLGVVMYECLTGKVPFTNPNPIVVVNHIIKSTPTSIKAEISDIPEYLEKITMGLLSKRPMDRKRHIKDFYELWGSNVSQLRPSARFIISKKRKKISLHGTLRSLRNAPLKRVLILAFLGLMFVGILIGIFVLVQATTEPGLQPADVETSYAETHEEIIPPGVNDDQERIIDELQDRHETSAILLVDVEQESEPDESPEDSYAQEIIDLLENQMIEFNGQYILNTQVSNRIWNMVMANENTGNQRPATNFTFRQVQNFISMLNNLSGQPYSYSLPDFETLYLARSAGVVDSRSASSREWVRDPVISQNRVDLGFAHYYQRNFDTPSAWQVNNVHGEIAFRLMRNL